MFNDLACEIFRERFLCKVLDFSKMNKNLVKAFKHR